MPDSGLLPSRSQPVVAAARNPHPPLSVQVSNVLSTTISDGGFREALFLVEDRLAGNYLRTKRRLRINILREVIDTNAAILDDFGHVVMQLCQIRSTLTGLNKGFEDMRSQAIVPCLKILPILTDASSLFQKQVRLQQEHKILTALRNHYIMSQEEMAHLTITAKPVDDQFFIALSRAKIINKDCTFLLGFEGQVLGSKRALRTMAERPSLFQQSLELFTEARERYLTDAFLEALAGSESSHEVTATLKPIDLIAHDPTRYVGDMFAWVHSTAVTELEAVDTLFVPASDESTQWIRSDHAIDSRRLLVDTDADAFDAMWTMGYLVDRNVEGISRVLRQRVEHVIHSNEEVTTAYRLVVVIKFYGVTLQKLVGGQSNLLDSIGNLESQALRQFRALVRDNVAHHQMELQHAPSDLGPPVFVHDVLSLLEVILKIYESSVSESHHHDHDISFIISDAFDPCMSACKSIAASLRHPHDTIFVLNCELAAAKIIKKFKFLHKEMNMLQNETSIEAEKLIAYQTRSFRTSSGLDHLLTEPHNINEKALEEASQQLDNFLPSAVMDAMERLDCLLDAELSRFVIQAAAHRFYDDFEQLERSIEQIDKKGVGTDGPRLRTYFPRTLAEIRVLLS
ncbi:hypothetical protein XA68_11015 [Ophiocordyceps unilateralis]|uniref:Conserved oligomeric Golgi complex subunit 6 n=1 Tax=Ophiocordyceps unilateralis TaxID=268505 RepID=A0A2A9P2B9_OPHUN|nr:hypothetical protein XA68_11015 [Ophiocordyceps unilateralis]